MHWLVLSILCSVTVSVLFKLARRYSVNIEQMIAWNYPVAVISTYCFLNPKLGDLSFKILPLSAYGALGLLMPTIFLAIASSIRYTGIVRTEVAQRMSLFIPLLAAFFIFDERPEPLKIVGLSIGLIAIICSIKWQQPVQIASFNQAKQAIWAYPLLVFVGMGIIDILYKHIAQYKAVTYNTSIFIVFVLCTVISFAYLAYVAIIRKRRFSLSGTLWGIVLGIFNFGNIIFYMRAHQAIPKNPSIVFSSMNIGVIILGALVGILLFKEKLSLLNKVGLLLALIAVLIISLG